MGRLRLRDEPVYYEEIRALAKPEGRGGYLSSWELDRRILEDFAVSCGGLEMLVSRMTAFRAGGGNVLKFCTEQGVPYGALMAFMRSDVQYSRRWDQAGQDRRERDAERARGAWDEVLDLPARDLPSWTEKLSASEKMAKSSGLLRDGGGVSQEPGMTEQQIREKLAELLARNPDVKRQLVEGGVLTDVEFTSDTARHETQAAPAEHAEYPDEENAGRDDGEDTAEHGVRAEPAREEKVAPAPKDWL